MSGTFTTSETAPIIDAAGIRAPDFAALLETNKARFRAIYGNDLYLESDSQDGELILALTAAQHDANSAAIAVYAGFSPATAQGVHLARMVKINGLTKPAATYSVVDLAVTGTPFQPISNGIVRDRILNTRWLLPDFTFGADGRATVTARAAQLGNIPAQPGALTVIGTPQFGWTDVTNAAPAIAGEPVELDSALRLRQAASTALPSRTILDGLQGALEDVPGVARLRIFENDTAQTDANGIPRNSVAVVLEGGQISDIARVILAKKGLGAGTYGSTSTVARDAYGNDKPVKFSRPAAVRIKARVGLRAFRTFSTPYIDDIKRAIATHVAALPIGQPVILTRVYMPANLNGSPLALSYEVLPSGLALAREGSSPAPNDVALAWNEVPIMSPEDVDVTVTTG